MSVRRVSIQTDRGGDPVTVDVSLPSGTPVAELVPAIRDLVDDRSSPPTAAVRWRLDRAAGGSVDDVLSLADNGIHDGELLTLSRERDAAPGLPTMEPGHAAVTAHQPAAGLTGYLPGVFCTGACTLASVALAASAGSAQSTTHLIVAAVGACAAATTAVATGYGTAACVAFACLAAATGFLAVPSAPAAPNVLLAAAAALAASLSMMRLSGRVSSALTATAALSLLGALATVVVMPVVVVGALLSCTSLALLAMAPRLSVLGARLGGDQWDPPGSATGDVADRVETAHAILTGLVVGGAAGVASGAVVVAAGAAEDLGAMAFLGVLVLTPVLRARSYADPIRRIALGAAGLIAAAACLRLGLAVHRGYVAAAGGSLAAVGLLAVRNPLAGAIWSRLADRLEYAALVAVVPGACWISGAYDVVGGLHPW
jgi:type VII secretion integral membrane protein EccD